MVASNPLLWRHTAGSVGTCWGIAHRENHSVSDTFTVACRHIWCWLISEAVRREQAFPLKLAALWWGNLGYNEKGGEEKISQLTKVCACVFFKIRSTRHRSFSSLCIIIFPRVLTMMRNPLWTKYHVSERRPPPHQPKRYGLIVTVWLCHLAPCLLYGTLIN